MTRHAWRRRGALTLVYLFGCLAALSPVFAQIDQLTRIGGFDTTLGEGAAEIVAYDPGTRRLFVVNAVAASIDIVNLSNPTTPVSAGTIDVTVFGAVANSVAVHNGIVAVAIEADIKQEPGTVAFFNAATAALLGSVQVGALPDMVTFTPDGSKVLVANEGEPNDAYDVDPEGTVSIIDLTGGFAALPVQTVSFAAFNLGGSRAAELPPGVRVFGPNASVAQDLEPEYIAVSDDGITAWVALQENNAFAVIDINAASVIRIDDLGTKNHSAPGNAMDASNRDDGINIETWPIFGFFMPDGIASFSKGGVTYVLSANEGDSRDYDGFSEEERVADLELDAAAFPGGTVLQMDENLGRLKTTSANGDLDGDGDVDRIYSYGARSFSIWNGHTGTLVFDSGDDFEQITAQAVPALFNSDESDPSEFDDRSDDKGPEPESVVVGSIGSTDYAFIGLERVGGIMVYDITEPANAHFVTYAPPPAQDKGPEGLVFISGADSPNGQPLLVTGNEVSGTVSVFQIGSSSGQRAGSCSSDANTLCIGSGRFAVEATWTTAQATSGAGLAVPGNDNSGSFYFFDAMNTELVIKTIDACATEFNSFWIFAAGMTDVGVKLIVTDTVTGTEKQYTNPLGTPFETITDTAAFATCP